MSNLVDIICINNAVKCCVEVIEEAHHLQRVRAGSHIGEAHNVTEEHGHLLVTLRVNGFAYFQLFCHCPAIFVAFMNMQFIIFSNFLMLRF